MPLMKQCDVCGGVLKEYELPHIEIRTPFSRSLKKVTIAVEVQHVVHMEYIEYAYVCKRCVLNAVAAMVYPKVK